MRGSKGGIVMVHSYRTWWVCVDASWFLVGIWSRQPKWGENDVKFDKSNLWPLGATTSNSSWRTTGLPSKVWGSGSGWWGFEDLKICLHWKAERLIFHQSFYDFGWKQAGNILPWVYPFGTAAFSFFWFRYVLFCDIRLYRLVPKSMGLEWFQALFTSRQVAAVPPWRFVCEKDGVESPWKNVHCF